VVAVLGAGNGGCAAASDLTLRGFDVRLYNRTERRLTAIRQRGGIELLGVAGEGFAEIPLVTTELEAAVAGAEVIVLCLPVSALTEYAPALAPLVADDQVVFLNPGHMGGSLYFRRAAAGRRLHICETATLTYACRMRGPATVAIFNVASDLLFAALPASKTDELYARIAPLYPKIARAENVLQLGLQDLNAVEHPAQALLNAGWLEHTKGDYLFYIEGTTPSVARVIEAVDRERMALAQAIGVPTRSFVDYFFAAGYTSARAAASGSVYEALQDSEPNSTIKGPPSLDHRYIHEDVGWGLVPWIHLARAFGVAVPTMEALTHVASLVNQIDYLNDGLTLERMGLAGLDRNGMARYVNEAV
jgi:opine dehydrogenase